MYSTMLTWLDDLDGVEQNPVYHPEGCALFHTLQVFEHALSQTTDPDLLAAALFHDIGKAHAGADHDEVGADMLLGAVSPRTVWLVRHHLDLLRDPKGTRALLLGTPQLADLERLRTWDLAGRDPHAEVRSPEEAVSILLEALAERQVDHATAC